MPEFSDEDVACGLINLQNEEIIISSVYMDINVNEIPKKLIDLCNFCNAKNKKLIISTDSNSHSMLFGGNDINDRGEMVENFIFEKHLEIMNDGIHPTFTGINDEYKTYIDLTLTSPNISDNIANWTVDNSVKSLSDHRYITFKVTQSGYLENENNCNFILDYKKCNWNKFRKEISEKIEKIQNNLVTLEDNNNIALELEKIISQSLKDNCPKLKQLNRKVNKWWTPELNQMRKTLRKLNSDFKKNKVSAKTVKEFQLDYKEKIIASKQKA